jgi:hypothetical protein
LTALSGRGQTPIIFGGADAGASLPTAHAKAPGLSKAPLLWYLQSCLTGLGMASLTTPALKEFRRSHMTHEERQSLIAQYKAGYEEVARSLEGFPVEQVSARPLPGKWSAREIVQHLADSEMNSAIRLRKLLTEENPQIQGYDQEDYAARLRYNERDMAPALDALRGARATTAQLLEAMSDEDWGRAGTHSESGRYTAEDWLRIYAAHAHNHASQIGRLRAALEE